MMLWKIRRLFWIYWIIMGVLLAVGFHDVRTAFQGLVVAFPWCVGAIILARPAWGEAVASRVGHLLVDSGIRACLIVLLGVSGLATYIFTFAAVVLVWVWFTGVAFVVLTVSDRKLLRALVPGFATLAVTLTVAVVVGELVLRMPPLANRLGTPAEVAGWRDRYDGVAQRNIFGFRSAYETVARTGNVHRTIVLGDSFTWGDKIANTDSTWPARWEYGLERTYEGADFEVINMAERGYTTYNEAELLHRLGWQFHPDLIVIQYYINDALPSGPNFQRKSARWLFGHSSLVPVRFQTDALASSALVSFMERQFNALLHGPRSYMKYQNLYKDTSRGWRQMQAAISRIAASARARSVPVVFMMFPSFLPGSWTDETYPLRGIYDKVAQFADEVGFEVLNLTAEFVARGGDWSRWWATPYDGHPGLAAHAVAAEALLEFVRSRPKLLFNGRNFLTHMKVKSSNLGGNGGS